MRKVAKIKEERWGRKRKWERKRGERVGRAEAKSWRKDWKEGMPKENWDFASYHVYAMKECNEIVKDEEMKMHIGEHLCERKETHNRKEK